MLNLINTKLLVAILAVVTVLGGILYREHTLHVEAAQAAARAAMLLQQQQNDRDAAQQEDKKMWDGVRARRQKQDNMPAHGSKPWTHYLP